jgi:hypothetical protein
MSALLKLIDKLPCDANYNSFIEELTAAGYAIVPLEPTRDMILEGLHPAIPGNVSDIYREMLKAAPKVAA